MDTVDDPHAEKQGGKKKAYIRPEINEVWSENIGLAGAYLLEM